MSSVLIRPIATPATGASIGTPASNSARQAPQTVAIDDEPFDSRMSETTRTVYGNSSSAGSTGEQRAARQDAVADLAPAGAAQELDLAHRERREVVVEHELLVGLLLVLLDELRVAAGAQRDRGQRLGLAAGEQRRAVRARQRADLDRDVADLVERAAVEAAALVEDGAAQDLLLEALRSRAWCAPTSCSSPAGSVCR